MKKSVDYLELCVYHPYAQFDDYPVRFCMIRIPFDHIHDTGFCSDTYSLAFSQCKKLTQIGFDDTYLVVPHRPCDKQYAEGYYFPWDLVASYIKCCDQYGLPCNTSFEKCCPDDGRSFVNHDYHVRVETMSDISFCSKYPEKVSDFIDK